MVQNGANIDLTPFLTKIDASTTYATQLSLVNYLTTSNASSIYATKGSSNTFSELQTFSNGLTVSSGIITLPSNSISSSAISGLITLSGTNMWGGIQDFSFATVFFANNAIQSSSINGLSDYLTISNASSTYATTSSLSNYLTTANASSTYATKATNTFSGLQTLNGGLTVSGTITLPSNSISTSSINGISNYLTTATASSTYATTTSLSNYLTTATASSTYATSSSLSSYLTTATASSTYATKAINTFTGLQTLNGGFKVNRFWNNYTTGKFNFNKCYKWFK